MALFIRSGRILYQEPFEEVRVTKYVRKVPTFTHVFYDDPITYINVDSTPRITTRTKVVTTRRKTMYNIFM
ncbi:unnamed protein product [Adineta steineri]|uniref:Uncharacterized protein n=1 Tax=Adineta steineri TaxID=433720 RepID=A0A818RM06_9BILA|nr:unnamed protein product [Adineta steineri]CAF0794639.1 unnamed protein product [Adineta steineri]CAF3652831.1 unnamed protein product [Adineta steineri]CAF3879173.1 unnamed protein product [Adineta steineri]